MSKSDLVDTQDKVSKLAGKVFEVGESVKARWSRRDDMVDAITLSVLSGADLLALGTPGAAKSAVIKDWLAHFKGKVFSRQLNQFSSDKDLLGDVNPKLFMETGRRVHEVPGTLLDCDIAFVDEVFKGSKGARTALLEPLADRQFSEDGKVRDLPLLSCLTASNELPASKEDAAFYSRLQIRVLVEDLKHHDAIEEALFNEQPDRKSVTLSAKDIAQAREEMSQLRPSRQYKQTLRELLKEFDALGIVSDQRKRMRTFGIRCSIAQANAWLHGRSEMTREDLAVAQHVFWNKPSQILMVRDVVGKLCRPEAVKAVGLLTEIEDLYNLAPLDQHSVSTLENILQKARYASQPKRFNKFTAVERARLTMLKKTVGDEVLNRNKSS